LFDKRDNFIQRRAREENSIHAALLHDRGISLRDRSSAPSKQANTTSPSRIESPSHLRKKFDMAAVVAGNSDGPHIFLHRGPGYVICAAMVAQINDLDAMADQFEIDGADGAVMPVA